MVHHFSDADLNVGDFTTVIEDFTSIFIRLPSIEKLSFTTLFVLHTLSRKGPLRLSELTATEQLTQPAITQMVTRLEHDGLVERRPDPGDGRAVRVHLTALGARTIEARHADRVTQFTRFVEHLSPDEQRAIASALPALARVVELGRNALSPLTPLPSASSEQHAEHPKQEE
jgi:DNA-binding MarR family transcriptional regulator